ncbi:hypothetical protein GGD41_000128 [Paraburkholderia bryophila]|uniref:Uncharacterized protein n=1 Tax=Paraburkholderia bryophila TaxID=420952 RepID=A0A7Y9W373_9BURK|nr:hypothetical protein [Paraburkholderia bryophila]
MEWANFHRLQDKIMRKGVGFARTEVGAYLCHKGVGFELLLLWILLAQSRDGTNPKIKFRLAGDVFLNSYFGEID